MALYKNPDLIKVSKDDPNSWYLESKIKGGQGIAITKRNDREYGHQLVIHAKNDEYSSKKVVEVNSYTKLEDDVFMALIDSSERHVELVLPHPADFLGILTLVSVDNTQGITLRPMEETHIFDASNMDFNAAGDSLVLASDRKDTWYCVSRYTSYQIYS